MSTSPLTSTTTAGSIKAAGPLQEGPRPAGATGRTVTASPPDAERASAISGARARALESGYAGPLFLLLVAAGTSYTDALEAAQRGLDPDETRPAGLDLLRALVTQGASQGSQK